MCAQASQGGLQRSTSQENQAGAFLAGLFGHRSGNLANRYPQRSVDACGFSNPVDSSPRLGPELLLKISFGFQR